jgi:pre-rRNA-processing protein TSR1
MELEPTVLAEPDPSSADSLVSCNDPDDLANEQTWPTEEEMQGGEKAADPSEPLTEETANASTKRVRRIPKGMSEYQASWIVDETEDEGDEDEDEDEDGHEQEMEDVEEEEMREEPMPDDDHDMDLEGNKGTDFQDLDPTEENEQ